MERTNPGPTYPASRLLIWLVYYNVISHITFAEIISPGFCENRHLVSERVEGKDLNYTPDTSGVLDRFHFTPMFTPQGPGNSSYYIHITSQIP